MTYREQRIIEASEIVNAAMQRMAAADDARRKAAKGVPAAEKAHARAKDAYLKARAALLKECIIPPLADLSE